MRFWIEPKSELKQLMDYVARFEEAERVFKPILTDFLAGWADFIEKEEEKDNSSDLGTQKKKDDGKEG